MTARRGRAGESSAISPPTRATTSCSSPNLGLPRHAAGALLAAGRAPAAAHGHGAGGCVLATAPMPMPASTNWRWCATRWRASPLSSGSAAHPGGRARRGRQPLGDRVGGPSRGWVTVSRIAWTGRILPGISAIWRRLSKSCQLTFYSGHAMLPRGSTPVTCDGPTEKSNNSTVLRRSDVPASRTPPSPASSSKRTWPRSASRAARSRSSATPTPSRRSADRPRPHGRPFSGSGHRGGPPVPAPAGTCATTPSGNSRSHGAPCFAQRAD